MKKFLIVGSKGAVTFKNVFPYMKDRKVFMHIVNMVYGDGAGVPSAWYNNIRFRKKDPLVLTKKYTPEDYPKYDNYDAIEVSKVKDIPYDYDGVMGVPITFLDKWDGSDFEVLGFPQSGIYPNGWKGLSKNFVDLYFEQGNTGCIREGWINCGYIDNNGNAVVPYARILIKKNPINTKKYYYETFQEENPPT